MSQQTEQISMISAEKLSYPSPEQAVNKINYIYKYRNQSIITCILIIAVTLHNLLSRIKFKKK